MALPGARRPVPLAITGIVLILVVTLLAFNFTTLFGGGTTYKAEFSEAAGLQAGDKVTIAGVEAGRVDTVALDGNYVLVSFDVQDAWVGDATSASIEIRTLLGAKYLALDPQGQNEQDPSQPIPLARTASPLDVVDAFNGLSGTIDQIDTKQLATSLSTLADTFRNTPDDVRSTLDGLSRLSTTIAGRDDQIKQLLAGTRNLSTVLADRSGDVQQLLSDGNLLLGELQQREDAIANLLDGTRKLSQQLSGLVADNQEQLRPTLETLSRVVDVLQQNQDNLANTLKNEATFVRLFANAVGNGRWFDNYICGLLPTPSIGPLNPGGC
ncbi:MAG: phospholipid/cholesterol/gamma-HCH transport system substrate-binding protein [Pseudonocardiales bacterium]|jgi:phospholipid/cholesterol/gamma-HCH transport system substrate-binding protein|nr:phospholipid/cholesterol/gamma-HCH transport system substrate-binding protein [Pseudonocardiales bacterium]